MVKQKVVIKVHMNDSKSRSKALKIAVGVSGVESAALGGNEKSQIEVTGEIDAVVLATLLRKNIGHAEFVSVSAVGEKKEEKKDGKKEEVICPKLATFGDLLDNGKEVKITGDSLERLPEGIAGSETFIDDLAEMNLLGVGPSFREQNGGPVSEECVSYLLLGTAPSFQLMHYTGTETTLELDDLVGSRPSIEDDLVRNPILGIGFLIGHDPSMDSVQGDLFSLSPENTLEPTAASSSFRSYDDLVGCCPSMDHVPDLVTCFPSPGLQGGLDQSMNHERDDLVFKQKVVIKVHMNDFKSRSKALKIAVGVSGVESAALGGNDKSQIEVTGEIDAVVLATLLRKNIGHAELVSVSAVGEKKEEKKDGKKEDVMYVHSYQSQYQDNCSIM